MKRLWYLAAATLAGLALVPAAALAQTVGSQPTAIGVAVAPRAELGQEVQVQARLVTASGAAIPKAVIFFTTPVTFLNASGDMVVARATTDAQGIGTAVFQVRQSGQVAVKAEFRGDATYAPAKASTQLQVVGSAQLYDQKAGVHLPGLNAPVAQDQVGWPHWALSGWPIAAALMIVWSLFGTAVYFLTRIPAGAGGGEQDRGEALR